MKLASFIRRTSSFSSQLSIRNVSGFQWYSTETLSLKRNSQEEMLYRRISPIGSPYKSIVPVLDQWIEEGRDVKAEELRTIIRELRHYRRFTHALEVSQWMTDKRYIHLSVSDIAIRLGLIGEVRGVEQAENYFNITPKKLRTVQVYGALLSCYARGKSVEKAEALMQKMRDLGFASTTLNYNVLLTLYSQTGNREKLDILIQEMDEKGIKFDSFTYCILLNRYGAHSGIGEMEKILTKLESDSELNVDWNICIMVANHYVKAGFIEKALIYLRKAEKLIKFSRKKNEAFSFMLTLYAAAGKKDEVLRVWKECKICKLSNKNYIAMLTSILKFDDREIAEKIFEEWEASDQSKDIRIPNILINAYCKEGLVEKAEALIERIKTKKWEKPNKNTWSLMSSVYIQSKQMPKAVEAMESAVLEVFPGGSWKPYKETLAACLNYLKEEGDIGRSSKFIGLLWDKGIIPGEIRDKLLEYVSGDCDVADLLEGDCVLRNEDTGKHRTY